MSDKQLAGRGDCNNWGGKGIDRARPEAKISLVLHVSKSKLAKETGMHSCYCSSPQ